MRIKNILLIILLISIEASSQNIRIGQIKNLQSRLNAKLNISDTGAMLSPYFRFTGVPLNSVIYRDATGVTGSSNFTYTPSGFNISNSFSSVGTGTGSTITQSATNTVTSGSSVLTSLKSDMTLTAGGNNDDLRANWYTARFRTGALTGVKRRYFHVTDSSNNQIMSVWYDPSIAVNRVDLAGISFYNNNTVQTSSSGLFFNMNGVNWAKIDQFASGFNSFSGKTLLGSYNSISPTATLHVYQTTAASDVLKLQTVSSSLSSNAILHTVTQTATQTTGTTVSTVNTFPTATGVAYRITAYVSGIVGNTGTVGNVGGYIISTIVKNNNGTLSFVGTPTTYLDTREDDGTWDSYFEISGTNVLVRVLGSTSTTPSTITKWSCKLEVNSINQ